VPPGPISPDLAVIHRLDLKAGGDLAFDGATIARMAGNYRTLLDAAVADPDLAKPRAALLIGGIEWLPEDAYRRMLALEAEADAHGYTGLN